MPFALISPNEPRETGYRVAQVEDVPNEVASPLFWVPCNRDDVMDAEGNIIVWYDPSDQSFKEFPPPPPPPEPVQPTTQGTQTL